MEKEEIIAGLRQAIERGHSLEQAKQSFLNAGYNSREVEEAAASISGVLTEFPEIHSSDYQQQQSQQTQQSFLSKQPQQAKLQFQPQPIQQFQPIQQYQQPKKSRKLIIFLIIFLLILIAGLIATIFFKEKIVNFIMGIIGATPA